MTHSGSKEAYVGPKPCSCEGLNPNCFKCYGLGMYVPRQPFTPEFNEVAYRAREKKQADLAKKRLLKKDEMITSPKVKPILKKKINTLTLGKKTKKLFDKLKLAPRVPVDKYAQLTWTEPYYCTNCDKYLTRVQLSAHSQHFDQILERPNSKSLTNIEQKKSKTKA